MIRAPTTRDSTFRTPDEFVGVPVESELYGEELPEAHRSRSTSNTAGMALAFSTEMPRRKP
jgi:hypothetical protein